MEKECEDKKVAATEVADVQEKAADCKEENVEDGVLEDKVTGGLTNYQDTLGYVSY